ncbi:MAG: hypothetical protein IKS37_03000 [Solobacterium sp.]|nr:hypothetical protein [Solobacterium sp.]
MLQKEPLELLSRSYITNDLSLPYWIYQIENIVVTARRFLKVYLLNRTGDGSQINRITFQHAGKDYVISDFRRVSKYDDPNYMGCVIEVDLEDTAEDLMIVQEIVGGKIFDGKQKACTFHMDPAESPRTSYLKKKHSLLVYPQIQEDYWLCGCGRIHAAEDTVCACRRTKHEMQNILDFDYDTVAVEDYLKVPMTLDPEISFDDNMNRYTAAFTQKYPHIPLEKLLVQLDTVSMQKRYEQEKQDAERRRIEAEEAAERKAARKKKIRKIAVIAAVVIALLGTGGFIFKDQILFRIQSHQLIKEIKENGTGYIFTFGEYEQDNNVMNGKEPIAWQVLQFEGNRVLVISEKCLDYKPFNNTAEEVTWESSDIRSWLNTDFYNSAFTSAEQNQICLMNITADHNNVTDQGNATQDHVFLLSYPQAVDLIQLKGDRTCTCTPYAKEKSQYKGSSDENLTVNWVLRTMGESRMKAVHVNFKGNVNPTGTDITEAIMIRPAIWINLDN